MNTKSLPLFSVLVLTLLAFAAFTPRLRADDFPPAIHIFALDPDAAEAGSDPATFLVVRIGPTNAALTVSYEVGGSAINCVDYAPLSGEVTIPSGSFFAPITVTPIDDDLVEGNESVIVALQQPLEWPPPYFVFWPNIAFAEIEDNDFPPTNAPPRVAIVSPPDGSVFDGPLDLPIIARATDSDGRVRTVEFFAGTNSLGIVTNYPRLKPVPVLTPVLDPTFDVDPEVFPDLDVDVSVDPVPIPNNLFVLVWSNAPPGHHVLTALATDNLGASTRSAPVEIKIHEPPPQPVVTVKATDPEATEPNPFTDHLDTATFTIHRTGSTDFPLTVYYRLGGTAGNGVDYRGLPYTATIPRGERTVDVVVEPLDDNLIEGDESVVLKIEPPVCIAIFPPPPDCYVVGRAYVARAVIHDNDQTNQPPRVAIVRPLDGSVFIAPATIKIAAAARDYDGRVVTVEFFEGTNSLGIVTNTPLTTSNIRPPFMLVWSNVPLGHYVLTAEATDNDGASSRSRPVEIKVVPRSEPPIVSIETTDPIATEPGVPTVIDTAEFVVSRTGDTARPLLVYYSVGGTASNGVDYRELSGKVTIPAGAAKTNILIVPLDDRLIEGTETVGVTIDRWPCLTTSLPPDCYHVGTNNHARAIIRDNDFAPTNHPPKVAIVKPEEGDVFRAFSDIAIYAATVDPDGYVRTVEFFAGTNSLGIVSNGLSPVVIDSNTANPEQIFRLVWSNVPPGGYTLTAKATDNRGAMTVSGPVHIRVLEPQLPPVVAIYATDPFASEGYPWLVANDGLTPTGPSPGPTPIPIPLTDPARFTVKRSAGTNVDLVVYYGLTGTASNGVDYRELSGKVTILRGSWTADIVVDPIDDTLNEDTETVIATLLPIPCPRVIPPPPECYIVGDPARAAAYIRDNDENLSPRLTITEPPNGAVFCAPADIKIEVITRDPDGWVQKVEFYAGTNLIGVQEIYFIVPPPPGQLQSFSMVWTNVPAGGYVLTAVATDNLGAKSVSDRVEIKVANCPPIPVVIIEATDRVASEQYPWLAIPPDTATFRVSRHGGDFSRALKVFYRISGTASNGVDYRLLSGELLIPQNAASAPIIIDPIDDNLYEGTESVIITLVQPPCATSDTPTATDGCYFVGQPGRDVAYIRDNDAPPNRPPTVALISPPDGSVFESPVNIRLVAAAGDSDGWVATVEFFDGTNSLGIVTNHPWVLEPANISKLRADLPVEISPINPFVLIWSNAPSGHHVLTALATDNLGASRRSVPVEITVLGPNIIPIVNIIAVDAFAREGTDNTATFRVRRRGNANDSMTVFYVIRGTASNGVDYATIPNYVTIPAGRRSARITIKPIDDNIVERIETVILRLVPPPFGPVTYVIGRPARAGAVIVDNDHHCPPTLCLPDGSMHVFLPLDIGLPYRLEASTDLLNWEPLFRNIVSDDESGFVDDEASDFKARFYRVMPEALVIEDD